MNQFELAELIELHDSGAVIRPREYSDCVAGWGEYLESPMKTLSVSGEHLQRLCDHLGIQVLDRTSEVTGRAGKKRTRVECLHSHEFPLIEMTRLIVGDEQDGRWIEQLSARVISRDLLEILVKWGFKSDTGPEFEEVRITYCGAFTVWWKVRSCAS